MAQRESWVDRFAASYRDATGPNGDLGWYALEDDPHGASLLGAAAAGPLAGSLVSWLFRDLDWAANHCESPIEEAMLLAFVVVAANECDAIEVRPPKGNPVRLGKLTAAPDVLVVEPQFQCGRYRADFRISHEERWGFGDEDMARSSALVECDGHDFHDRTKEQARRDRQRDRKLQAEGFRVFRFTGSELWADPLRCAHEAWQAVADLTRKQIKALGDETPGDPFTPPREGG